MGHTHHLVSGIALHDAQRWARLLAFQPQGVIHVAPTKNCGPLDVCAVHGADSCRGKMQREAENEPTWRRE